MSGELIVRYMSIPCQRIDSNYCLFCRAIEAAADGTSDVVGMAYWWSNCIQLRWMLWAMCHGGEMSEDGSMAEDAQGMDEFDWVMKVGDISSQTHEGCEADVKWRHAEQQVLLSFPSLAYIDRWYFCAISIFNAIQYPSQI